MSVRRGIGKVKIRHFDSNSEGESLQTVLTEATGITVS